MVSKHISIWRSCWTVWIDCLHFKHFKNRWCNFCVTKIWYKCCGGIILKRSKLWYFIEEGSTYTIFWWHQITPSIFKVFKVQTVDPNRSTWPPYWNVLRHQNLHFFEIFYYLLSILQNRCFQPLNFYTHLNK